MVADEDGGEDGTSVERGEGFTGLVLAVLAGVLATAWWGFAGLGTENFGSDCAFRFGESGPRAEHCHGVNDRAKAWLPLLVLGAWGCAAAGIVPRLRYAASVCAMACLALAVVLGVHAMAVSSP
ncbi:hypothetical protein L7D48_26190 [Streptomyces sp. S1A]|uniref:Uncharacterized protein n=1 Tax=Streptomyces chitinivorans TaxID=1257027 RepID=A0ABW7HN57_9ACTN|nr:MULTISPECIES: hypothetical protein [Streptomyces]MCG3044026.1 hypothetical protein [Streptomyces sp. ICN903]MDH2411140.1 hypothetical protein [Streptomyces chitinivorans]